MKAKSFKTVLSTLLLPAISLFAHASARADTAQLLSAGTQHVCALSATTGVSCWGSNSMGQLGNGTTTTSSTPVAVTGLSTGVLTISSGYQHSCALMSDSTVRCWGRNDTGQLGNNSMTNASSPVTVSGLSGAVAISAGSYHTCAVLGSGSVQCWGNNANGSLGDGSVLKRLTPVAVSGVSNAIAVTTGLMHTCALLGTGSIQCWGLNADGQLGNGTTTTAYTYVNVSGLTNAVSISAGQYHTCALTSTGGAKCWGSYVYGQLGNGMTGSGATKVSSPADVTGLTSGVASVMATVSGGSTCALLTSGSAQCWGYNGNGQLGTGDKVNRNTPASVTGLPSTVATMTIGGSDACARLSTGSSMCWGSNNVGQQGAGNTTAVSYPQSVVGF